MIFWIIVKTRNCWHSNIGSILKIKDMWFRDISASRIWCPISWMLFLSILSQFKSIKWKYQTNRISISKFKEYNAKEKHSHWIVQIHHLICFRDVENRFWWSMQTAFLNFGRIFSNSQKTSLNKIKFVYLWSLVNIIKCFKFCWIF
jgi:hypothetical protein